MSSDPDFSLIRFQNDAANSYLIAWTAILFWDWLILVRLETVYIWKAKTTPLKIAFLLQRYGTLIFMTIAAVLLLSPIPYVRCQKIFWLETLGLNFALVTADVLLSLRVLALYDTSRAALVRQAPSLSVLMCSEIALLIAAACYVKPVYIPDSVAVATGLYGCIAGDPKGSRHSLALILYALSHSNPLRLDGLKLTTVYKSWAITRQLDGTRLPILQRLVHDGALYFACILAVNVVNVYFYNQKNDAIKSFNVCAVVVLSSTLSCRLALSLLVKRPQSVGSNVHSLSIPT
ncbi:hypothetical protein JCM3766R1_000320 [Sporobolomyces carnicolor]